MTSRSRSVPRVGIEANVPAPRRRIVALDDRLAEREHAMHRLYSDALHAESVDVGVWQKVGTNDAGPEHVITPLGPVWIEAASSPEAS